MVVFWYSGVEKPMFFSMVVLQPYISAHLWLLHQTDMKERHATERRTTQFLDLTFCNLISLYYARSHSPLKPQQNKECALWMGGGEKQDNGEGKGRRRGESTAQTSKQAKELETQNIFFYSSLSSPDCMSFPSKTFFPSAKKEIPHQRRNSSLHQTFVFRSEAVRFWMAITRTCRRVLPRRSLQFFCVPALSMYTLCDRPRKVS